MALLGVLAMVTTATAAYWNPDVVVREGYGQYIWRDDMSARGRNVAVAFTVAKDRWSSVIVRESVDGGASFEPGTRPVSSPSVRVANLWLATAGGRHHAVWTEPRPIPDDSLRDRIFVGQKPFGSGAWSVRPATPAATFLLKPKIAATSTRTFVVYKQGTEGTRAKVTHALTAGGPFGPSRDLGPSSEWANDGNPDISASADLVVVVWADSSDEVWLQRGRVGPGPGHAVTWSRERSMGPGAMPRVAVDGNRIAFLNHRDSGVWYRGSTDGGATFSDYVRVLTTSDSDDLHWPSDLAIAGSRVLVTTFASGSDGDQHHRASSMNGGATWYRVAIGGDFAFGPRQVAFMSDSSGSKIAETWIEGEEAQRDIVFHRQH